MDQVTTWPNLLGVPALGCRLTQGLEQGGSSLHGTHTPSQDGLFLPASRMHPTLTSQ